MPISEETAQIKDIYETLAENPKSIIKLTFDSSQEAEAFRVRLYRNKRISETMQLDLGFIEEDEIQSLSVKHERNDDGTITLSLSLKKRLATTFKILIITPDETE